MKAKVNHSKEYKQAKKIIQSLREAHLMHLGKLKTISFETFLKQLSNKEKIERF